MAGKEGYVGTAKNLAWDNLGARDQWLLILGSERREDRSPASFLQLETAGKKLPAELESLVDRASTRWHIQKIPQSESPSGPFFLSHYKAILRALPLRLWGKLVAVAAPRYLPFTTREASQIARLASLWRDLERTARKPRLEAQAPFLVEFGAMLAWKVIEPVWIGNESVMNISATGLTISLPPKIPVIFSFVFEKSGSAGKALKWTRELRQKLISLRKVGGEAILNIVVGRGVEQQRYIDELGNDNNFLIFTEGHIKEILSSDRYTAKAADIIKAALSLSKLNPYRFDKPVDRPAMFFGRDLEVRTIVDNSTRDFMVIGARQIGKSSLLAYLRERTSSSRSRLPIVIDCSEVKNPQEFAERVASQVNPRRAHRIQIGMLSQLVRVTHSVARIPYLFLLDEADQLINLARKNADWSVFHVLRELSNAGVCQTVIAGYKALYEAWQDLKTPIFNFVSPVYLSVLTEGSARSLVREPLRDLGLEFKEQKLVDQIIEESGCHPSFLQFFCSKLIEVVDERGERRWIRPSDVHAVQKEQEYREFILKPFQYTENLTPLERWLVLTLTKGKQKSFGTKGVVDALVQEEAWLRASDVRSAFQGLELAGLFSADRSTFKRNEEEDGLIYSWTIPAFPIALEKTTDLDRLVGEVREQVRDEK